MTSAFIIEVNSQLQSDPNEETAALLRVLLYKMDNTTFGDTVPKVPQWSGPERNIVQVQAILYASLAASLFSAFLAMLGKQWLNRYASGVQGSVIERGRDRQRKLDGIITWYFNHVMESLPVMLQFALLLLGCALSHYLSGIDATIALVVIGITSFGVAFYIFIVIAGAASGSCPYQTPGSHILYSVLYHVIPHTFSALHQIIHHTLSILHTPYTLSNIIPHILTRLHSIPSSIRNSSYSIRLFAGLQDDLKRPIVQATISLISAVLQLPFYLVVDAYLLMQAMIQFIPLVQRVKSLFHTQVCGLEEEVAMLDLQSISWVLQTSLDKAIHMSTLKHLSTVMPLSDFTPTLVSDCFNILLGCMTVAGQNVVITQGLEELATTSAMCCIRTFSHLAGMDSISNIHKDMYQQYVKVFPHNVNFKDLPLYVHTIFYGFQTPPARQKIQWVDYNPSSNEHIIVAHSLAKIVQFEYQRRKKVPRWLLHFALHSLSQGPQAMASITANCLLIIAIDLGCTISNTVTLDERYVYT